MKHEFDSASRPVPHVLDSASPSVPHVRSATKRGSWRTGIVVLASAILLSGCGALEPLPDFRYYALPSHSPVQKQAEPSLPVPLVIESLRTDGVRGERPILYTSAVDRVKLLQYHYQLWSEPPTTLVQQFLLHKLGDAGIASLVTDSLSLREPAWRISGALTRFERIRSDTGWAAQVEMRLRVSDGSTLPLLDQHFHAEVPASDENLETSIAAFSQALDQISDELLRELQRLPKVAPAPTRAPAG